MYMCYYKTLCYIFYMFVSRVIFLTRTINATMKESSNIRLIEKQFKSRQNRVVSQ